MAWRYCRTRRGGRAHCKSRVRRGSVDHESDRRGRCSGELRPSRRCWLGEPDRTSAAPAAQRVQQHNGRVRRRACSADSTLPESSRFSRGLHLRRERNDLQRPWRHELRIRRRPSARPPANKMDSNATAHYRLLSTSSRCKADAHSLSAQAESITILQASALLSFPGGASHATCQILRRQQSGGRGLEG